MSGDVSKNNNNNPSLSLAQEAEEGKSSYYVWFLGARESKGLRGEEFVIPVARSLLQDNKRDQQNVKLTLQVSARGIGIEQASSSDRRRSSSSSVNDAASNRQRQFVPHSSITCAFQASAPNDDVVSCILLMQPPPPPSSSTTEGSRDVVVAGKDHCPLYVHCYRCDSPETAAHLQLKLQALVDRPENLAKYGEIEARLAEKGLLISAPKQYFGMSSGVVGSSSVTLGSDGRSLSGRSSSESSSIGLQQPPPPPKQQLPQQQDKLVSLQYSLAAELRERLERRKTGKVAEISPSKVLGKLTVGTSSFSSDQSSGIGSEEPPSPKGIEEKSRSTSDWKDNKRSGLRKHEVEEKKNDNNNGPFISIQPYSERKISASKDLLHTSSSPPPSFPTKLTTTQKVNIGWGGRVERTPASQKKNILGQTTKSKAEGGSFQDIQRKFKSLEQKNREQAKIIEKETTTVKPLPVFRKKQSQLPGMDLVAGESRQYYRKISQTGGDEPQSWAATTDHNAKSSNNNNNIITDSGRSSNGSRRLENYLLHKAAMITDRGVSTPALLQPSMIITPRTPSDSRSRVRRQSSRCSGSVASTAAAAAAAAAAAFPRNMEQVGEFEKVWSWTVDAAASPTANDEDEEGGQQPGSTEYGRRLCRLRNSSSSNSRPANPLAPVEQQRKVRESRQQQLQQKAHQQRGLSSPAEMRRYKPNPYQQQQPQQQDFRNCHLSRRAPSPDCLVRSNRCCPSPQDLPSQQPFRVLRREKTSLFDNRYPSLDVLTPFDRRKSLCELQQEDANIRRRSYHELHLAGPELMLMQQQQQQQQPFSFAHSGKKSKCGSSNNPPHMLAPRLQPWQQQQHHHLQSLPPDWSDPRAFAYVVPRLHQGIPSSSPIGRFGIAQLRQY